jgi:hypothetical protein
MGIVAQIGIVAQMRGQRGRQGDGFAADADRLPAGNGG